MVKKILVFSVLIVIGLLIFNNTLAVGLKDPLGVSDFGQLLKNIAKGVRNIVGALAGIMFVISGITFLVSGGSPELTQKAKSYLMYAVIGTVIALTAEAMVASTEVAAKAGSFEKILEEIAKIVGGIVGSVATIMFVISGIMFLLSGGNPNMIQKAKSCLLYAVIGAVVALSATIIAATITTIIGTG